MGVAVGRFGQRFSPAKRWPKISVCSRVVSTLVFGINSANNAVRKCEIVRGKAECYFTLPDCIASAINPNTTVCTILLQINPTSTMSLIGTVLVEHSMLLLLKNLTIVLEGQLLPTYCGSDIDRCGHGCWVRVQYGIEVGTIACVAPSSSRLLYFRSRLKVRKLSRYCCFSHTTVFTLN